ncbi:MAG: hypothetical protein NT103_00940 [Campylobacterales bacterium]|nr:hypothetical protein [Campylobacterales bacterium]
MKTVEIIMIAAFISALVLSLYKIYLFLPQKPLADDDTTPESVALLEKIMVESNRENMSEEILLEVMMVHAEFDKEHFWRFNLNKLQQLIRSYRLKEPNFRL